MLSTINIGKLPQTPAAENQFSFQQKSSKHLQELVNRQMS